MEFQFEYKAYNRLITFINEIARYHGLEINAKEFIKNLLLPLLNLCGPVSQSRKIYNRIAKELLTTDITIIAPCCPDYGHSEGVYTFQGLFDGISLLAQKQIAFLKTVVQQLLPQATVILVIADQEALDPYLCECVGKTQEEFSQLVKQSIKLTAEAIAPMGWRCLAMTESFDQLIKLETNTAIEIMTDPKHVSRLEKDTYQRTEMYRKINPRFTYEQMFERTARTASQYLTIGRLATANGWIICNHHTVNLHWYLQTEAAVLHNPITVY